MKVVNYDLDLRLRSVVFSQLRHYARDVSSVRVLKLNINTDYTGISKVYFFITFYHYFHYYFAL